MDLRSLRYFVEVARVRSLSRAAGTLHIAQSALSRQMQRLEHEVGGMLFRRSSTGVEPTQLGTLLLARAERVLGEVAELRSELNAAVAVPRGRVRLAVHPGPGQMLVPRLYERLQAEFPKLLLQVTESNTSEIDRGIRNGSYDAALFQDPGASPSLARAALIEEPIYLVGRPGGPLHASDAPIAFQSLAGLPLIMPMSASLMTRQLLRTAAALDVRLEIATQVTSVQFAKAMVRDQGGQTILGFCSVREELLRGELAVRPIAPPPLTRRIALVTRRIDANPAVMSALLRVVKEEVALLADNGTWTGKLLFRRDMRRK